MYEAVTEGVRVRVRPQFDEMRSKPADDEFFWLYSIDIVNEGSATVRLMTRAWLITDAQGRREVVQGEGVVGETPVLGPGQKFSYTSGCPLTTPSGIMSGTYGMQRADGTRFDAVIPAFSLDSPHARRTIN